jgi:hypothetical protein
MFGHKLNFNSANRFGHKNTTQSKFGHKSSHSRNNSHSLDDGDEDKVPKRDLERNTREYHGYHNAHNPSHR